MTEYQAERLLYEITRDEGVSGREVRQVEGEFVVWNTTGDEL